MGQNKETRQQPTRRGAMKVLGAAAAGIALPACGASSSADDRVSADSGVGPLDSGTGATDVASPNDVGTDAVAQTDTSVDTGASTDTGASADTSAPLDAQADATAPSCALTPEQVEGPFFVDTGLDREDIREGREGVPLRMKFTVVDAETCEPIAGAAVEVWHADAGGSYSGFDRADGNTGDHEGTTFLRGFQRTSAAGEVVFSSVYPGWYPGRAPHVHVSVLVGEDKLVSTQCYFDDAVSESVYAREPYAARGVHDTFNADDTVSFWGSEEGTAPLLFELDEQEGAIDARFVLGVVQR